MFAQLIKGKNIRIFMLIFLVSGSLYAQEYRFLKEVHVSPFPLEYFRDSVRFQLTGEVVIESVLFPRNPRLELIWKAPGHVIELGELELIRDVFHYDFKKEGQLPYASWMREGYLELRFYQGRKDSTEPYETRIVASGLVCTPLLAQMVSFAPGMEHLAGLPIRTGLAEKSIIQSKEFAVTFEEGSARLPDASSNQQTLRNLQNFLHENPEILTISITGIQSPEVAERRSLTLGMERAQALWDLVDQMGLSIPDSVVKLTSRRNDWFDFRLMLREEPGLSPNLREQYYAVLTSDQGFVEMFEALGGIPGFEELANRLFPKLRIAKVEIQARSVGGIGFEKMGQIQAELQENRATSRLSEFDWLKAGEFISNVDLRKSIFQKMTVLFHSPTGYINLAVMRMREGQLLNNLDEQANVWNEVEWLLQAALQIEETAHGYHNLGQVYAFRGDYVSAYRFLSLAAGLSKDSRFLQQNDALRGSLDIVRGDYKLGIVRLEQSTSDPVQLFNKGLAYYLSGDFGQANLAFEQSVLAGRSLGYGYYGLALIALQTGQAEIAKTYIEKATSQNERLQEWLRLDPTFEGITGLSDRE